MKNKPGQIFCLVIDLLIIFVLIIGIYNNTDKLALYTCALFNKNFTLNLGYLLLGYASVAYIGGFAACMFVKLKSDELCNAYQKRHENISIENDENAAKIASLEAKIATLEVALESALKNK